VEQADPGELRPATERWFIGSGLPHLIRDYNVREDILTRAAPVLMLVFLAELAFGGERGWRWWQNTLGLVAGRSPCPIRWAPSRSASSCWCHRRCA
jgi:hypothetical protein